MLKVSEFLSVATQLAFNSAQIIHQVRQSSNLGKQMKGVDDPVTLADIKSQTHIVQQIAKHWPQLKVVGEEETKFEGQIDVPDTKTNVYPDELFKKSWSNLPVRLEYEIEKLCLWVDPLDGTLDFVQNTLDNVTTLIGLTYENRPIMGVIGQPYEKQGEGYEFKPKVYFGHTPQGVVYYTYDPFQEIPFQLVRPKLSKGRQRFVTQKNRIKEETYNKIKELDVDILMMGGAGKKTLCLLEGNADYFIYVGSKTSRWDICAPEALVNSFGGHYGSLDGEVYQYDSSAKDQSNPRGVLATMQKREAALIFAAKTRAML